MADDLLAPAATPPATVKTAAGGWYRRDETNTLYYRPIGHADPFIAGWLDATVADDSSASRAIFVELSSPKAPGLCTKCHSVDATNGQMSLNWQGSRPQPNVHHFTRFKHDSHFSIAGDKGCQTCHAIDSRANYSAAFTGNRDPAVFQGNFERLIAKPAPHATPFDGRPGLFAMPQLSYRRIQTANGKTGAIASGGENPVSHSGELR